MVSPSVRGRAGIRARVVTRLIPDLAVAIALLDLVDPLRHRSVLVLLQKRLPDRLRLVHRALPRRAVLRDFSLANGGANHRYLPADLRCHVLRFTGSAAVQVLR